MPGAGARPVRRHLRRGHDQRKGDDRADDTITVPMSGVDGSYYVALGQVAPSGSEADPSSPRPSSGE